MIDLNAADTKTPRNQSSIPALRIENLSTDFRRAKVLDVRPVHEGRFGKQVDVKLTQGGGTYIWYIRLNDPNLKWLVEQFGADETQWPGNEFAIGLKVDDFNNKLRIRCEVAKKGSK